MENVYKITPVVENNKYLWSSLPNGLDWLNNPLVFKDESGKFIEGSCERSRVLELPNPTFIRIHAAIAGILHMSGAGRFFDELLAYFGQEDTDDPVRCWAEFESIIEKGEIED